MIMQKPHKKPCIIKTTLPLVFHCHKLIPAFPPRLPEGKCYDIPLLNTAYFFVLAAETFMSPCIPIQLSGIGLDGIAT